ncbi:MAG: hypothetical protein ACPGR8_01220 [Limisphaerales bacterium]
MVNYTYGYEAECKYAKPDGRVVKCICRFLKFIVDPASVLATTALRQQGNQCLSYAAVMQADVNATPPVNPMWVTLCNPRTVHFSKLSLYDVSIASVLVIPAALDGHDLVCGTICADELIMIKGKWQLRSSEMATRNDAPLGVFYNGENDMPQRFDAFERPLTELRRLRTLYGMLATVATAALGPETMATKFDYDALCLLTHATPHIHEMYRESYRRLVYLYINAWLYNIPLHYAGAGIDYPEGRRSMPRLIAYAPEQSAWTPSNAWPLELGLE